MGTTLKYLALLLISCSNDFTSSSIMMIKTDSGSQNESSSGGTAGSNNGLGGGISLAGASSGGRNENGGASTGGRITSSGGVLEAGISVGGRLLEAGMADSGSIETGAGNREDSSTKDVETIDQYKCLRTENLTQPCGGNGHYCCNLNCYTGCNCQYIAGTKGTCVVPTVTVKCDGMYSCIEGTM